MSERVDKINYYLDIAETVAERSTCLRKHYGCIIVKNDEIISTGYSGAPRGRKNCIDLGPILFCFSALKKGAKFINTKRLKIKESDRVNDLALELNKFGVKVIDNGNEVIIDNTNLHAPKETLNGRNDHRIVMALSLMLSVYGGEIEGYKAVNKSFPNYFECLEKLGIEVEYVR